MRILLLPRPLLLSITLTLLLRPSSLLTTAIADCTRLVTAKAGDTCATIADAAGITITQFLRANPGITTCANLAPGSEFCIDPNFASFTTLPSNGTATAPGGGGGGGGPTDGSIIVSRDGRCGAGQTCLGSAFGSCCSSHEWCGRTPDHCGLGCQASFGICGAAGLSSGVLPPVGSGTGGNNNGTVSVTSCGGGTGATQIVYVTQTVTTTTGVASTVVTTVTQISLTFISSTVTTIRTITITDTKMCRFSNVARATAWGERAGADVKGLEPEPVMVDAVVDCELCLSFEGLYGWM